MDKLKSMWMLWKPYASITLLIAFMTAAMHPFGLAFDSVNIALLYLLPVLWSSVVWGLRPALYAAMMGVLAFDFFFVSPILSFTIADLRYLISFGVFFGGSRVNGQPGGKAETAVAIRQAEGGAYRRALRAQPAMSDIADIHSCSIMFPGKFRKPSVRKLRFFCRINGII
ncbi:hypothetical protein HMSSN036_59700 [Paenibacillus macerans]|nr:hypothetical protein HMSSN036_59700 [Paenibacillus macerans]